MHEELLPNLFRIEIPLPNSPLKTLNSYLIKAQERFLIIDTGMNREECAREMLDCLDKLAVNLKKTDFFITHLHADHMGLVGNLATDTSRVYFSELDANIVTGNNEYNWREMKAHYRSHGFPQDELDRAMAAHPGRLYSSRNPVDFSIVKDGDIINIGDYSFRCIETSGHTPGHMCLYESEKKVLVSGDHILFDITPNITSWLEVSDSLGMYLASLDKVFTLDADLVLPGHRNIQYNHKARIIALKDHHQARLREVLCALSDGEKNAFQIAPHISWDIDCKSWELFPAAQKVFAIGETIAHIEHLEANNMVRRRTVNGEILFSLA